MAQAVGGKIAMSFTETATRDEAFALLAMRMRDCVSDGLKTQNTVRVLLSGGSTPAPAYALFAQSPLDWKRVLIGLVDERWVDEDCAASNGAMIRKNLLVDDAASAQFFPIKNHSPTAYEGLAPLNEAYEVFSLTDIVVLGMGPDGHTASWFPGSDGLEAAMNPEANSVLAAINAEGCPVAGDHTERVTVTFPVILNARHVFLLITGSEKRQVLDDAGQNLPIHRVLQARQENIEVIWSP